LSVDGSKCHRLLVLIAAYADAGEESPAVATLAAKIRVPANVIDLLLARLERDELVHVERGDRERRERNRYRLGAWSAEAAKDGASG
jgi:DNA-binding IscR family transcriptional regulator